MPELLAPSDVEAAAIDILLAGMTIAEISTAVPNPRPSGAYARVTAAGGQPRNLIQVDQRLLLEFWDDDDTSALNHARLAWALLFAAQNTFMTPGVWVAKVESTMPVNFEDPATKSPRYQFISTLTTSLEAIA